MATPTPEEIRAAASYLKRKKLAPPISPLRVAAAAKEQGKSFSEIVRFIMRIYQGQTQSDQTNREVILAAAESGK